MCTSQLTSAHTYLRAYKHNNCHNKVMWCHSYLVCPIHAFHFLPNLFLLFFCFFWGGVGGGGGGGRSIIMEYGSTPYVWMAPKKNGVPIKCVQNDMFITLV